jgi:ATP-dependent exoDNAse (exonuclease V) beta subunit
MRLYTAVEKIIHSLRLGPVAPAYCEMFLQHVLEYSSSENEGVNGFLKYWDQSGYKASIRVPETAEGVQILTIHKAKGLEFPVVIFPLSWRDWGKLRNDLPVWLDAEEYGLDAAFLPYSRNAGDHAVNAQWEAEKQRQLLDELNVCYVATTRARDQLHLLLEMKDPAKSGGVEAPVSECVYEVLRDTYQFDPAQGPLELGDPTLYPGEETPTTSRHVNDLKRGSLEDRLRISFDKEQLALGAGVLSPRALGDEVHNLLAGIKSTADLHTLDNRPWPWSRMDEATWQEMVRIVKEVVEHPDTVEWFEPEADVACERELISAEGKLLRPDRLVFRGEDVHVIDYKTGEPSDGHKQQMLLYAQALKGLVSGEVRASLFYTDQMRRVDVPVTPTLF